MDENSMEDFESFLPKRVANSNTISDLTPMSKTAPDKPGKCEDFHWVLISEITVNRDDRHRTELPRKHIEELKVSISKRGLMHPIVITREKGLAAGECRLVACDELGWKTIKAQYTDEVDPKELKLLEWEENARREDLDDKDKWKAIADYYYLYKEVRDPEATKAEAARQLRVTPAWVSMAVKVDENKEHDLIKNAKNLDTGLKKFNENERRRKEAAEAAKYLGEMSVDPSKIILNESFLDWAPMYDGPKFSFIHCDFTYGIDADKSGQGSAADQCDDCPEGYWELLSRFHDNFDRFAEPDCQLMFWFSQMHREKTLRMLRRLVSVDDHALIWHKSDNKGILPDHLHSFRRMYETAFFGRRGSVQIIKSVSNIVLAPTANTALFKTVKPEPVLRHFFAQIIRPGITSVLDPTCGSGTALRIAEELKANRVLGLEIDPRIAENARNELLLARKAREDEIDEETLNELESKVAAK
jgi:hypothetical protein